MKMNKLFFALSLSFSFLSTLFSNNFNFNQNKNVKASNVNEIQTTYNVTRADVNKFKLLGKNPNLSSSIEIDENEETLKVVGSWDSAFAGTYQFDTTASSYYLKAHCYNANQGDSNDGIVGFNFYYNNITTFNIYLHWMSANWTGSIASMTVLAHNAGADRNIYEYTILPSGGYDIPRYSNGSASEWLDCWTDYGGWTTGTDRNNGAKTNMRTSGSTILLNKGFDMTLYVDRMTHNNRLVDVMQLQIDAYESDGVTPKTFFTPKYAFDMFTCPKGEESPFKNIKPHIGFWNYNVGEVTYSNIEFGSNKTTSEIESQFNVVGNEPTKAITSNDDNSITIENENYFNDSFYVARDVEITSSRTNFKAHLSGTNLNTLDSAVGYNFYYDKNNYVTLYFRWDGTCNTIDGFHVTAKVNGNKVNAYQGARNPWDNFTQTGEFKSMWSDSDGFITDCEFPCGLDDNFNNIRDESAITLSTGFDMGIIRYRSIYKSRTIDAYQMYATSLGTDSKTHTWYSPLWCMDAFTYPNGSEEKSSLIDANPSIGFYVFNCGEVTISDLSLNDNKIIPIDPTKYEFGSRTEEGWAFVGSNLGKNWTFSENTIFESWKDLRENTHLNEVNALKDNVTQNFYMSANLSISKAYSSNVRAGMYPYYLDENNYLCAYLNLVNNNQYFVVSGKLNGTYLGGNEYIINQRINYDITDGLLVEIGINENTVDFYLEQTPKATFSCQLSRDAFKDRTLENAKSGFNFYNTSGVIRDINIGSEERINSYTPSEDLLPIIYQYGTKETTGYVGYEFNLPHFIAFNYLNEAIDVNIVITNSVNEIIKTLTNEYTFNVEEEGIYNISVYAVDEWGHESTKISYNVNFVKYLGPNEVEPKEILWQTVVVLSFFFVLILITIGCGLILVHKNRKEALRAQELNKKNHQKHLFDDEEE